MKWVVLLCVQATSAQTFDGANGKNTQVLRQEQKEDAPLLSLLGVLHIGRASHLDLFPAPVALNMDSIETKRDSTMGNATSLSTPRHVGDAECSLAVREYVTKYLDVAGAVFVHIPRTGGTSITYALFGENSHSHYSAQLLKDCSVEMGLAGIPMFAVMRNPFERLVSSFALSWQWGRNVSFSTFVSEIDARREKQRKQQSSPIGACTSLGRQVDCIYGKNGEVLVDHILHTEHLNRQWATLQAKFPKLPDLAEAQNTGDYGAWCDYYNPVLAAQVASKFAADFDFLNLPTDLAAHC
jgi:hypothetical protein